MKATHKKLSIIIALLILIAGVFIVSEMITTYKAHETFEGYCKWRGLVTESKTSDSGYCRNPHTGQEYKMVLFNGRWFLDGDLPCGFLCF